MWRDPETVIYYPLKMDCIVAHICCLLQVHAAPSCSWPPGLSACPVGGCSSSLRAHRAVSPPLVLLMDLTAAPHPHHLDLLCLRYGYRPLEWEWRLVETGVGGWESIWYENIDMSVVHKHITKILNVATLQSTAWQRRHFNCVNSKALCYFTTFKT